MAGVNKVILIGNLGGDPDLRYTQGGTAVCSLNLATTRSYTKANDQRAEETEWHRVIVWGKQAELCHRLLAKGRQCYVEGRLHTRNYEDKDGIKRYVMEVVAEAVQFLGGRGSGGGRGGAGHEGDGEHDQAPSQGYDGYVPEPADDDIPF